MENESLFNLPNDDAEAAREVGRLQCDIYFARSIVRDALNVYIKKQLKARSKKEADNVSAMFAELDIYESAEDIRTAYGWEEISAAERDRLINLWELRANYNKQSGRYSDRVTDLIERAIRRIGDEFEENIGEFDERMRRLRKEQGP